MMAMKNAEIIKIAESLQKTMLDHGVVVQRYDAYSTNSIYLKLDYGVCNSIRISDHRGKKHLKYRYNIGPFIEKTERKKDKFDRFYYPVDKMNNLVRKILADKKKSWINTVTKSTGLLWRKIKGIMLKARVFGSRHT